jgi:hypothetical protein
VENTKPDTETTIGVTRGANYGSAATCSISKFERNVGTVLQPAKSKVCSEKGFVDHTYVSSNLVKKVKPKWLRSETTSYSAFGENSTKESINNVYDLKLTSKFEEISTLQAVEVPVICTPMSRVKVPVELIDTFRNFDLADDYTRDREVSVDILVGLDSYWRFMRGGRHKSGNLVAQETMFGWVLSGSWNSPSKKPIANQSADSSSSSGLHHTSQLMCIGRGLREIPESDLRNFWELESIGIDSKETHISQLGPDLVLKHFLDEIVYIDGRYEVALPWDPSKKNDLVNNYGLAKKRLGFLTRRFEQNPDLKIWYDEVIREFESLDFITEIKSSEMDMPYPVYYLPHHPVVREDRLTTKVRPVFDASAVGYNKLSLNNCMFTGPSLNPDLVEILITV